MLLSQYFCFPPLVSLHQRPTSHLHLSSTLIRMTCGRNQGNLPTKQWSFRYPWSGRPVGNAEASPITCQPNTYWEYWYSATHRISAMSQPFLPRERDLVSLDREPAGTCGRCGWVRKIISSPMEFEPWIVQPIVSSYTDFAIPAGKYFPLHCVL